MKGQRDRPDIYGVLAEGLDQPARDQALVRATSPAGDGQPHWLVILDMQVPSVSGVRGSMSRLSRA